MDLVLLQTDTLVLRDPSLSNFNVTMHFSLVSLLSLSGLVAQVSAHGLVREPATRAPGEATEAACGKIMVDHFVADSTSYPEALLRANPGGLGASYDPKNCNLWFCKGYQFADNAANVQSYTAGQVIDFDVWIRIPHSGHANVSVVDTASNSVIGEPLIAWPANYAASANPPADQTKFSVEIPELGDRCAEAGACVSTSQLVQVRDWID
jgi:hypothetical protein